MRSSDFRRLPPVVAVLLAVLTGGLAAAARAGSTGPVPATDPAILYEGRFATGAAGTVRLGFPGVTAHLRLRGSSLTLHLLRRGNR